MYVSYGTGVPAASHYYFVSLGTESRFTSLEAGLGNNLSAEQRTVVNIGERLHERVAIKNVGSDGEAVSHLHAKLVRNKSLSRKDTILSNQKLEIHQL